MQINFKILLSVIFVLTSQDLFGQGAAVIIPMSQYILDKSEPANFHVHNQLQRNLAMNIDIKCDVDGMEMNGEECLNIFQIKIDNNVNPRRIEIMKSGSLRGRVELIKSPKQYALLKPIFSPDKVGESKYNAVSFDFSYQPGYLFLLSSQTPNLTNPTYTTRVVNDEKFAVFEFDLKDFTMPAVASISAKIAAVDTKKTIRFVRLASEKIIDPRRKSLTLESSFASSKDEAKTCFDLIIQWISSKSIQKISNCTQ